MMKLAEKIVSGLRVQLSIRTAVTLLIGLGLFGVYGGFSEPWDHFVRDVGMAFLIAAIVTEIYERYAREAAAAESAEQIVSKLISDIVDPGVWRELREQILEKVAIRQSTTVQLKLGPAISPNDNRHRLWVNLTYRLTSLRSRVKDVKVVHFLDAYMRDSSLGLPRFIRIVMDGRVESLAASQDRFEKRSR
jgi:hypothetical protein